MSKQITTSPSNRKISALYKDIKRENLILQPDFQRRFVWNNKHKEKFIDTILEGYPVPEIYVAQRTFSSKIQIYLIQFYSDNSNS